MPERLEISSRSDVAAARQQARTVATQAGLGPERVEDIAIVATELTTNIVKYATGGQFMAQAMPQPEGATIALIASDSGPGIANLDRMRTDRVSGGKSAGIGIGAIERLSDRAEVVTTPEQGTIWACSFDTSDTQRSHGLDVAGLRICHPTETVCGDDWGTVGHRGGVRVVLADGMGHGKAAAQAGSGMVEDALRRPILSPKKRLVEMVEALRNTRGGVISILDLQPDAQRVDHGNLGNISSFRLRRGDQKRFGMRDGYIGSSTSRPMEERFDMEPGDVFVMHSDGLRSVRPDLAQRLLGKSALMVAALLLSQRDMIRRDDVSVAIVRWTPDA